MKLNKIFICLLVTILSNGLLSFNREAPKDYKSEIIKTLRKQILQEATWAMQQQPVTVTAQSSSRSAGGKHDFFSEGDYWWPNTQYPDSPYVQRDGMTNPDNFVAHRQCNDPVKPDRWCVGFCLPGYR